MECKEENIKQEYELSTKVDDKHLTQWTELEDHKEHLMLQDGGNSMSVSETDSKNTEEDYSEYSDDEDEIDKTEKAAFSKPVSRIKAMSPAQKQKLIDMMKNTFCQGTPKSDENEMTKKAFSPAVQGIKSLSPAQKQKIIDVMTKKFCQGAAKSED